MRLQVGHLVAGQLEQEILRKASSVPPNLWRGGSGEPSRASLLPPNRRAHQPENRLVDLIELSLAYRPRPTSKVAICDLRDAASSVVRRNAKSSGNREHALAAPGRSRFGTRRTPSSHMRRPW